MRTEAEESRAKKYAGIRARFFLLDIIVTVGLLAAFGLFLSDIVLSAAQSLCSGFYSVRFVFILLFMIFLYLAQFPLHLASSFFVERSFGLSKQSLRSWIKDEVKGALIFFVLSAVCIGAFYFIVRNFSQYWWIVATAGWIFFSVILSKLLPVIFIPMFFKYSPIKDPSLKNSILRLADKAKVPVTDVCKIDFSSKTVKANAALVGLGSTRKVVLADTLIDEFDLDETEAVVAHEFGHLKYKHIWKLLFLSGVSILAGFFLLKSFSAILLKASGASDLTDPRLLPLIFLLSSIFSVLIMPIHNFFSRILEEEADTFALELTGEPGAFVSVMKKLAVTNLADTDPSRIRKIFFYNHPPISERIKMAEVWRK